MAPTTEGAGATLKQLLTLPEDRFIDEAYAQVLGRPADAEGRLHYRSRLAGGAARIEILRELQASEEGRRAARHLLGLEPLPGRRWWSHFPLLRLTAREHELRDTLRAQAIQAEAMQEQLLQSATALAAQVARWQQESERRMSVVECDILMRAAGTYARDHFGVLRAVLQLTADRFIHEAFRVALQRAPQQHEIEHFRHLQAQGLSPHTLLVSLLSSREALVLRGEAGDAAPPVVSTDDHARVLPVAPALPAAPAELALRTVPVAPVVAAVAGQTVIAADDELLRTSFRPEGDPLVSVIIPVYGKLDYTLMCLRSIARHRPRCSFEVLVVDDRSPDNTVAELQRVFGLRLVVNEVNLGFVRSCNHGAAQARGRYLCFLNNDTEVKPSWLDELVATFDAFPGTGLVGSKLVYPDGTLQEAGGIMWRDASAWNFGRGQDPTRSVFNFARETDYCSGASILIEKSLFERLGRFDERYVPAYCEDSSLAFEVRKVGLKVIYQPKSEVVHYEGISHGTSTSSGIKAYQVENQRKFFELWQPVLEREHFPNAEHVFLARERAGSKPVVLVVDHYVPQPDRDAGSRTMWSILVALRREGYSVKFWPENLYNDPQYTPALERLGIEVIYGAEYVGGFARWMQENGRYLHTVLLSRPHISVHFLPHLRPNTSARILYYGHDVHHLRLQQQLSLRFDAAVLQAKETVERQEKGIWREVDAVLYPSDDETDYVQRWLAANGAQATARTLPPYAYDSVSTDADKNLAERRGILFVAGFGHPPNSEAAVWFVSQVLPLVLQHFPAAELTLVGSNPTEQVRELARPGVLVTGYVNDETLAEHYRRARVVVAPLLYGGGIKGKVIEAMRFGVPCVTTPTGAQGLKETSSFLPAHSDAAAFAAAVLELLGSDDAWRTRSAAGLAYVRERFSIEAMSAAIRAEMHQHPVSRP